MNHINKLLYLLLIAACYSCSSNSDTEKYQNKRDNVINVREKVKEIEMEEVLIGQTARLCLMNDYLIIGDYKSLDKLIHLFDKKEFRYLTSTAYRGQGPGEITNMGHIAADETNRMFYVNDHGKQTIFSYELDSVLANSRYMPEVKMKMNEKQFPDKYQCINDTLSIGLLITPIGNADFKPSVAKWNMSTGEVTPMKYEHPGIEKKRISFAVSMENGIYVECFFNHDLMTIVSLDGDLKYTIYGPDWSSQDNNKIHYYGKVIFCNNKILATYSGGHNSFDKRFPTKFLVFDINGDYIQTLETGYRISDYCYDKENNRIIMNLDDEIQFAYLNLDENMLRK
ncbi:hypothetical protein EZS27_018950 [termite gut metagenome]|uniref:6-bladed beta-propeller n=1 Tax=termite gut metagenome TaxID=433724 RepID=A0A5J4RHC3_9ZZZZ